MPNKPTYWGTISPLPGQFLTAQAQQFEALGLEGVFAPQVYGPPFIPLATAAGVTSKVRLATGIALPSRAARSRRRSRRWTSTASATAALRSASARASGRGARGSSACRTGSRSSTCAKSWRSSG